MKQHITSLLICATFLTGCYVIPIQDGSRIVQTSSASDSANAVSTPSNTLSARLYPTNAEAQRYGAVYATVSINQAGHGVFNTTIGGESFTGDATRYAGSRKGKANGAGASGRYINCEYEMNSSQQGMGQCRMSTGATFDMHINS